MTEPSDRAIGLAVTATPLMPVGEFARLIDAALAEARERGHVEGVIEANNYMEALDNALARIKHRDEAVKRIRAERDELAATVGRVRYLADVLVEQGEDHVEGCEGQADCAACVRSGLIDALRGESDE